VRRVSDLGGASIQDAASALFREWCTRAQQADTLDEIAFVEQVCAEVSECRDRLRRASLCRVCACVRVCLCTCVRVCLPVHYVAYNV
jgi:hypothetical protein